MNFISPKTSSKLRLQYIILTYILPSTAFANTQSFPDIELRNQQEQRYIQNNQQNAIKQYTPDGVTETLNKKIPTETQCLLIKDLNIIDTIPIDVKKATTGHDGDDSPIGKCVGENGLMIIKQRIDNELIKSGFITSTSTIRDYTPETEVLSISIQKGILEGHVINSPTNTTVRLQNIFPTKNGEILNLRDLEQGLDNLQNLTGANAEFMILPGREPNSSQISINYTPANLTTTSVNINNYGNKQTGKFQSSIVLRLNNPTGFNDYLSFAINKDAGNKNPGKRGTNGSEIQYAIPFLYWQFGWLFNNRGYEQSIEGYNQDYLYHGKSEITEVYASRILHRSINQKTNFQFKVYRHKSRNFIDDTEILVQRRKSAGWEWQLQHQQLLPDHILNGALTYRRGTAAFSALPAPEERFNEGSARMEMYDIDFKWGGFRE